MPIVNDKNTFKKLEGYDQPKDDPNYYIHGKNLNEIDMKLFYKTTNNTLKNINFKKSNNKSIKTKIQKLIKKLSTGKSINAAKIEATSKEALRLLSTLSKSTVQIENNKSKKEELITPDENNKLLNLYNTIELLMKKAKKFKSELKNTPVKKATNNTTSKSLKSVLKKPIKTISKKLGILKKHNSKKTSKELEKQQQNIVTESKSTSVKKVTDNISNKQDTAYQKIINLHSEIKKESLDFKPKMAITKNSEKKPISNSTKHQSIVKESKKKTNISPSIKEEKENNEISSLELEIKSLIKSIESNNTSSNDIEKNINHLKSIQKDPMFSDLKLSLKQSIEILLLKIDNLNKQINDIINQLNNNTSKPQIYSLLENIKTLENIKSKKEDYNLVSNELKKIIEDIINNKISFLEAKINVLINLFKNSGNVDKSSISNNLYCIQEFNDIYKLINSDIKKELENITSQREKLKNIANKEIDDLVENLLI